MDFQTKVAPYCINKRISADGLQCIMVKYYKGRLTGWIPRCWNRSWTKCQVVQDMGTFFFTHGLSLL